MRHSPAARLLGHEEGDIGDGKAGHVKTHGAQQEAVHDLSSLHVGHEGLLTSGTGHLGGQAAGTLPFQMIKGRRNSATVTAQHYEIKKEIEAAVSDMQSQPKYAVPYLGTGHGGGRGHEGAGLGHGAQHSGEDKGGLHLLPARRGRRGTKPEPTSFGPKAQRCTLTGLNQHVSIPNMIYSAFSAVDRSLPNSRIEPSQADPPKAISTPILGRLLILMPP